ncbi:hypothetical protein L1887_38832 [Cichorium endivia]|nr:hypothetical protein L1887_38832 [Cichorium endivia]
MYSSITNTNGADGVQIHIMLQSNHFNRSLGSIVHVTIKLLLMVPIWGKEDIYASLQAAHRQLSLFLAHTA